MTDKTYLEEEDDIFSLLGAIDVPESLQNKHEKLYTLEKTPVEKQEERKSVVISVDEITKQPPLAEKEILANSEVSVVKDDIQETTLGVENTIEEKVPDNVIASKKHIKSGKTSMFSHGVFVLKYCVTSVCIFGVLLLSTNYSAYLNIGKSYLFQDEIAQQSESLLNSVNAGEISVEESREEENIVKRTKEERIDELMRKEEQIIKKEDVLSMKQLVASLNKEDVDLGIKIVPYENRIVIPKIGKNIPLIDVVETTVEGESELNNIFMKELEEGIVRYPGSAKPGEIGNSFIFGHSSNFPWIEGEYNDVFSRLGQLETGDLVVSYYGQKKHTFKIIEKKVISPDDVSILKRDKNKKELTLMTCWPIGTTLNRLILVGELIEE